MRVRSGTTAWQLRTSLHAQKRFRGDDTEIYSYRLVPPPSVGVVSTLYFRESFKSCRVPPDGLFPRPPSSSPTTTRPRRAPRPRTPSAADRHTGSCSCCGVCHRWRRAQIIASPVRNLLLGGKTNHSPLINRDRSSSPNSSCSALRRESSLRLTTASCLYETTPWPSSCFTSR